MNKQTTHESKEQILAKHGGFTEQQVIDSERVYFGQDEALAAMDEYASSKDKEIEELKQENKSILEAVSNGKDLEANLRWEGDPTKYEKALEEIERLKGLIERGFDFALANRFSRHPDKLYQKFCKDNNIDQ